MTTLERVEQDASIEDGSRVRAIAEELVTIFESRHLPDLAKGVRNATEFLDPDLASVALLGYYARIAETEIHRFD